MGGSVRMQGSGFVSRAATYSYFTIACHLIVSTVVSTTSVRGGNVPYLQA